MDAATGTVVMTYEGTDYADEFVLHDGVLYVAVNDGPQRPWPGEGVRPEPTGRRSPPSQKQVWAIDAATGEVLWKAGPFVGNAAKIDRMASMRHLNLTVSQKGVFLIDQQHVVGLNRETGNEMWRIDRLVSSQPSETETNVGNLYHLLAAENVHTVVYHGGRLFVLHLTAGRAMKHSSAAILQALDPATGQELWRYDKATPIAYIEWPDVFAIGNTVWLPDRKTMTLIGLDTATGDERVVHSIEKALNVGHHHRCYPNRASVNFAVLGRRGAEFVDLKTGELTLHHWLRTGCRSGHVLGNGLFYRPPDHCQCYMQFQPRGFLAMSSEAAPRQLPASDSRLITGPAYEQIGNRQSATENPNDWPTYRHDPMRSAMATSPIPSAPRPSWQVELPGTLSAPIVAGGKVFVASEDTHQIIALDAATGERAWAFTAGGRVDSPPTAWQGFVLFGCRDGRVYCLRASDGALAWRFDAAPEDRRIVAYGQVESCWPVCGSVLVAGGTAYFVAGRTSVLDHGVYAYSMDVATGKTLDTQHIHEIQTETKTTGTLPEGALSDILTTDGVSVYLRKRRLDLSPQVKEVAPRGLAATRPTLAADGGFANRRWFHRAFWYFDSNVAKAKGNLIAFDGNRAYVAAANFPGGPNQTFHIPTGGLTSRVAGLDGEGPRWLANPNLHVGGPLLFAARSRSDKGAAEIPDPRGSRYGKSTQRPAPAIWRHNHFPIYPWAMIAGNKHLAVAGPPAEVQRGDPWAGFEGRAGGELHILDTETGKSLSQTDLDSPPVWNGMAAAVGRLYVSTHNGKLVCVEER
jgi:outer membrane protein assembly factor BamB